ncbi:MAG: hypothetical protein KC502_10545 [Myxococcales bacterium]|nr:hypothetical protein [Myxococcales bacterium]
MFRRRTVRFASLLTLILVSTAAASAFGYTVDRKLGIGFEQTLTALPEASGLDASTPDIAASGLVVQYWNRHVGLEAIVGGRALLVRDAPIGWAGFLTLGAHYNVFRAPMVNLSVGLRVTAGLSRPVNVQTNATQPMRVGFSSEIPLRAMFFLSDHFALTGSVGPVVTFGSSAGNPLTGAADTTTFSLFRGGFSGGLGFVVFFR